MARFPFCLIESPSEQLEGGQSIALASETPSSSDGRTDPAPGSAARSSALPFTSAFSSEDTRFRVEEFRRKHRTSLVTLLFTDLVDSTRMKQERGDTEAVSLIQSHSALVRATLAGFPEAQEISTAGDSFFCVFVRPSDAIAFALKLQSAMRREFAASAMALRLGIHLGEVFVEERPDTQKPLDLYGVQVDIAARVMSLAEGGQVLCTRVVFDNARQVLKGRDIQGLCPVVWLNHGPYLLKGVEDPVEVCEAGEEGVGVLRKPAPTEKARPTEVSEEELGWRPATDAKIPGTEWAIVEKLGEGGFGEVWLAVHPRTKERRVFKFCFLRDRLRALRHELALFRLIRESIGEHPHIARLHEVFLEEPPFYLGMEHVSGWNLREWLRGDGTVEGALPPLKTLSTTAKLDIAAQVAEALDAAHRAGVIHQDIKPQNILVDDTAALRLSGAPRVKLTDFGVGRVVNEEVLGRITITGGGMSLLQSHGTSSGSGTLLYMAPERVEGRRATPQSDLYSLGVVLFQMLAGDLDRAVTADWESEVADPVLRSDLRLVLAGRPEGRIASAGDLAHHLRTWRRRRRTRRIRRAAGVLALMVLAVGLTWAYFARQAASLRWRAEIDSGLRKAAQRAEQDALDQKRRFHEETERIKLERDEKESPTRALAHVLALLRLGPTLPAADAAWRLRVASGRLVWTSPRGESSIPADSPGAASRTEGHTGWVMCVACSPDGHRIASASQDGSICLWDIATGKELSRFIGHQGCVFSAEFSPDGSHLVSGSEDGTARLWDVTTGRELRQLEGHQGAVRSVAFSPDGSRIASGSEDGTIRMWGTASGNQLSRIEGHSDPVRSVAFSPDGRHIVSGSNDRTIRVWDASTTKEVSRLEGHSGEVLSVAMSPDGSRIVSGSEDQTIRLWDTATGDEVWHTNCLSATVSSVAFDSDGSCIASASVDGVIHLWDAVTGEEVSRMEGYETSFNSIAFSPDGFHFVSGSADWAVRLWEVPRARVTVRLEADMAGVLVVAFSPDKSHFVSGSSDKTIRLWDAMSGKEEMRLGWHAGEVHSLAISPDGRRIASASADKSIHLWDAATGKQTARFEGQAGENSSVAFRAYPGRPVTCQRNPMLST